MLRSMTGYGRAVCVLSDKIIAVEIKTLNSKHLDVSLRLPPMLKHKEMEFRQLLSAAITRGKVDAQVSVEMLEGGQTYAVNKGAIRAYYRSLSDLCDELQLSKHDLLAIIMRIPDTTAPTTGNDIFTVDDIACLKTTLEQALDELRQFRVQEGAALHLDLASRMEQMNVYLREIEQLMPERTAQTKQRLQNALQHLIVGTAIDSNRFEQELIYYLEKFDINEEITRLKNHCAYFIAEINNPDYTEKGQKLSFIAQEIGREINTIGAKANHSGMQTQVVQMKDELEKMKEQLMNVV